ncbi:MAG TPA: choice-of-anchor tandem repeat GloVer-containing protein [Rhizomicrobium sp.]|nr:choice-of-anchor tandem repeat GloVer-containing protein [Rhizomicrobium sp.]
MHMRYTPFHGALLGSVFALAAFAASAQAHGYTVLHDFAGPPGDGSYPYNNVTFDGAGNLYGAANLGGSANAGVIFEIAPDGTETVLYSFDGAAGGSDPNAGVTIDPSTGDLYGTTTFGGSDACRNGCGVLYELASDGTYTVLRTFNEDTDGRYPAGQLLRDKKGNLFGIATSGGPDSGGTVFEYSAKGKFTVLHAFAGSDGFEPQGNLIQDSAHNLYGVTFSGGADNYGTVFKITAGDLATLYSFTGGADGGYPTGGVVRDKAGNLYGATNLAGNGTTPFGTVFELAPAGTLTTLYAFTGGADGGYPVGNVLQLQGKIYGTTSGGGADEDGTVYEVDAETETVLHSFAGTDGATPQAGLTREHGRLYGTAGGGGTDNLGVVFSLKRK